ncbi:MAG: Shedu immune nuclease family protein [Ignavibacteria bacterium]
MVLKKQKKSEIPERHLASDKSGFCVYEIYRKSNKTIYHIQGSKLKVSSIILEGFQGLPSGLYLNRNGYGFGKKGIFLLSALKDHFAGDEKFLEITVSSKQVKKIQRTAHKVLVTLPFLDIKNLLIRLGRINEDNNNELRSAVASFLSTKFPKEIKISTDDFDDYKGGEIAALLSRKKVAQKLNEDDFESLSNFYPKIFEESLKGKKQRSRTALIKNTKSITDRIFLDEVINEFESNLSKVTLSENDWQKFLSEKVFRFLANYVTSIEKQNVSISVSYPDFVLVDVYGFIDVFEIKKHTTPLLSLDDDHDNYYWKTDISKAIAQIENYTDEIVRNSDDYIRAVKRKKSIDIRVVRPRGYIIAGTSKQFSNKKESSDFRILGSSLKNINFILYDELLDNLKNLRSKL